MSLVQTVIAEICHYEQETGCPPEYLKMKEDSWLKLVEEMAYDMGLSRQVRRQIQRKKDYVMILNTRIVREVK